MLIDPVCPKAAPPSYAQAMSYRSQAPMLVAEARNDDTFERVAQGEQVGVCCVDNRAEACGLSAALCAAVGLLSACVTATLHALCLSDG